MNQKVLDSLHISHHSTVGAIGALSFGKPKIKTISGSTRNHTDVYDPS
jgi:hypothetical protein